MARKWQHVLIMAAIACVFAICFLFVHESTAGPMLAKGAGPGGVQVTGSGWLAYLVTALGAGGFTVATFIDAVRTLLMQLTPAGTVRDTALAAVGLAEMPLYARIYNAEIDSTVKAQIRLTAKAANDAKFNREFPVDAVPK